MPSAHQDQRSLFRGTRDQLRAVVRAVIAFQLWSTLVFAVSFVPASAWLLNRLIASSGQFAISDHDLLTFVLSPAGLLFILLGVAFVLTFWFAEQAALLVIVLHARLGRRVSVSRVLWENIKHLPVLLRLGLQQAAVYVLAAIPFVGGVGLTYLLVLSDTDFYFYLNVQPRRWWVAVAIAGTLGAAYLVLAGWLYARWLLSIPTLLLERTTPKDALRMSRRRTRGRMRELALQLASIWVVALASASLITWVIGVVAARLLADIGSLSLLVTTVLGTLALVALVDLACFIIAKSMHVLVMAHAYIETTERAHGLLETTAAETERPLPMGVIRAGWVTACVVLIAAGITAGQGFMQRFETDRTLEITGHRGNKSRMPENTLIAVRTAIAEGADFAEIDVQTTADGVVVLLHDGDLMRVALVNRRLNELDHAALRDIDVGSWFDPQFSDERIPTLQEVIDLARGRIRLNIELKYTWADPDLAAKVGRLIRENDFVSHCVVSSLNFEALTEVQRDFPELETGFIVFAAVGHLSRMNADFLSISAARATPRLVRDAHRRGVEIHVWTVNDPGTVLSMIELGVDNIITDEPELIRHLLDEWNALSGREKLALMLRNLIVGVRDPEPEQL